MRMITLQAPPGHGPSIALGGTEVPIIDDKVIVFDIYEHTLASHGFRKLEGADTVFQPASASQVTTEPTVDIPVSTMQRVLENLGVLSARGMAREQMTAALVEAASRQAERFEFETIAAVKRAEQDVEARVRREIAEIAKKPKGASGSTTPRFQPGRYSSPYKTHP